ncbi:MAG TPA: NAD(P)-dependent oxidoreductase [Pseudolabrys sp.]|jgi:3-hydroxyisobutyrate dehydrogenase-like beta-hydroxyacid dehydrogenase|nr:NAD(P)-dependent oxidoreductase [Pseudolabrys sp.]
MHERATSAPVGIVGLGLMGEVYAQRLIAAKIPVTGFDIDPARRARLAEIGGHPVSSVAELTKPVRCVIVAVFNTEQVEDVVGNHLLAALGDSSEKIVLCMSTCDPDRVAALAERVIPRGIRYLDVPVSGTSDQVRRGDGVALIGGDMAIAEEMKDVLNALFSRRFHVGTVGDGARAKLAVNLILGLNRLALAEGLVFAERIGLDPATFLKVARASASYSQVMETKGPKMVRGDFSVEGRVKQTLKDAHLMLVQAAAVGQKLSALELHADMLEACVRAGEADLDNSVIIKEVRRRGANQGGNGGGPR